MVTTVGIGGRQVGPGQPCFVIAEAGVNHNGDLGMAKELDCIATSFCGCVDEFASDIQITIMIDANLTYDVDR